MSYCPKCYKELSQQGETCPHCGSKTGEPAHTPEAAAPDDDGLEIVVTEAHDSSGELVGDVKSPTRADDLGLQSTADLVQFDQVGDVQNDTAPMPAQTEQIGQSTPPPPPGEYENPPTVPDKPMASPAPKPELKKLSAEEVKSIRRELYGDKQSLIDENAKSTIVNKINDDMANSTPEQPRPFGFDNAPIDPHKKNTEVPAFAAPEAPAPPPTPAPAMPNSAPKMAERSRGVAYFAKKLIQITGEQDLYEGDELTINNRYYVLRKKKLSSKTMISILVPIAAILLFWLGTYFTHDTGGGFGQIVGIVLNRDGKPFITGATIRLPELGRKFKSNSQGFFNCEKIERGSYKVEFIVGDQVVATDFATVVDGEVTMLTMKAEPGIASVAHANAKRTSTPPQRPPQQQEPTQTAAVTTAQVEKAEQPQVKSHPAVKTSPAKLKLAANVSNPRIKLDGKVLGAGNLTYAELTPGNHRWEVVADGYTAKSGEIRLESGSTTKLTVTLQPMQQAAKDKTYDSEQFYNSGKAALEKGNYDRAIADFDKAIAGKSGYADATMARADAKDRSGNQSGALDDYILAAEQYRVHKDYGKAINCYGRALSIDNTSVAAFLGRGSLYLSRGEEIAAVTDFEAAKDIDRRSVQAYIGLGKARFRQGLYKKAIKHFNDARSIDRTDPLPYQYLMLCYMAEDEIDKVKDSYDRFVEVASDKEINKLRSNSNYSAVMRVVENNN